VLADERFKLWNERRMPSKREFGLDPGLGDRETQLFQPLDLDTRERLELQIRERPTAPELLRGVQFGGRMVRLAFFHRATPLGDQLLEHLEVDLARLDAQEIPR
jgi:hypothetical protein